MDKLPGATESEQLNSLVKAISGEVQESVEYAIEFFSAKFADAELTPHQRENELSQILIEEINRTLINCLSADYPHLLQAEVDSNPRHEASWFVGGVKPPNSIRKLREGCEWLKDNADAPVDRAVFYKGSPYLTLRHKHILPAIISQEEFISIEKAKSVPVYEFDARSLGYSTDYKHMTNIPGYWPGSKNKFGLVSFQKRDHTLLKSNSSWKPEDFDEALHSQGILSSFAWTLAQACYQGFTTYNDLTYPINTQTVITNGQDWSFYQFQLNTTIVHLTEFENNPKTNNCWGTGQLKLYEGIENGKLVGFNEEVLKHLVKIYTNTPKERNFNLTPFLGDRERNVADIPEQERREFLEHTFKHLCSNRPRHLALPEIYNWEKIYKIDHKQRAMEPKRRFFERGVNPWSRTLDQHCPDYIPKVIRPGGVKSRNKFKKHYYP
ncbi:MRPS30 family protein [Megaselia abdita]